MQIKDLIHAPARELRELQAGGLTVAAGRNLKKEILRVPTLVQSQDNTRWVQVSPTVFFLAEAGLGVPWLAVAGELEGEMASTIIALSQLKKVTISPEMQGGQLGNLSQQFVWHQKQVLIVHSGGEVNVSLSKGCS